MKFDLNAIKNIVGESGVLVGTDASSRQEQIWSSKHVDAQAIVRPRTTQEVSAVLAYCYEHNQPVVVHGGLTGMVYGATTRSCDIALSTERMQRVESVDPINRSMTVQAGVKLQEVQEQAAANGLMFTLDLGARGSCSIGGNIATNAGGNQVIRYGMTRDMILGIEVVLADGTIVTSMNDMIKNNAGYDLKQLFIGTEGTLGVITSAVLRLREQPLSSECAMLAVKKFDHLPAILKTMDQRLGGTLTSFEVMWHDFYSFITEFEDHPPPLSRDFSYYALIEAKGGNVQRDRENMEGALASVVEAGLAEEVVIAQNQAQRNAFWAIRDAVEKTVVAQPMYVFDVSLRIGSMEAYVAEVKRRLQARFDLCYVFTFGHLGDGNIHFNIHAGEDPSSKQAVDECVYEPLRTINGSISAEHGIGHEKKGFLSVSRSPTEVQVMRTLKQALDPKGILNPGLIFDP